MTIEVHTTRAVPKGDVPVDDPRITALGVERPTSVAAVFRNLARVKPLLSVEAAAGDAMGRTTPLAGGALRASGVFLMALPASRGGLDASLPDQLEAVSQVARVDGGTGWTVAIVNASGWFASFLSDEDYDRIYPDGAVPTAFSAFPPAVAVEVDGDRYRVEKGYWNWGSGGYHAERWLGGVRVVDEHGAAVIGANGEQKYLGLWLPEDKVRQADNWDSLGVRGSGSSSYFLTESVEVPRSSSFDYFDDSRPYAFPLMGVLVGLAQHMVDLALEQVRKRGATYGERDQAVLNDVTSELDLLVFGLRGMAEHAETVRRTRPGGLLTDSEVAWFDGIGAAVRSTLVRVADATSDIYGSAYVQAGAEFGRILRDLHVALAHVQFRFSDAQGSRATRVGLLRRDTTAPVGIWDADWPVSSEFD